MGFLADIIMALVITIVAVIVIYLGGAMVEPVGDLVQQEGDLSKYNGPSMIDDTQTVIFKFVPVIGVGGSWVAVLVRQYRRQRLEAARPVRR